MRKLAAFVAITSLVAVLAGSAQAANTATAPITITVTVRSLCVSVEGTPTWPLQVVDLDGQPRYSTAFVVKNCGNAAEDFCLTGSNSANWTLVCPAAAEKFCLSGQFRETATTWADGDRLSTSEQCADGTKFGGGGKHIAANATTNLWLKLDLPTSTTATTEQTITVTVGCLKAA